MKIGVQLYSVRTDLEEDFEGTLKQVSEMGYDGVEFASLYGKDPKEVAELCKKYNLNPISAHVPFDSLNDLTEKSMLDFSTVGCKYIVIPYLQPELRPGADGFKKVLDNAERIGKAAKENGLTLLYHNHDFEFAKIGVGVACVIKGFVKEELSDGSLMEIPLNEPFPKREVGFAYKESGKVSKSLQSFLQFINRYQIQNQGNNKEVTQ